MSRVLMVMACAVLAAPLSGCEERSPRVEEEVAASVAAVKKQSCGAPEHCHRGATRPCYNGPQGTKGVGACHSGVQTCVGNHGHDDDDDDDDHDHDHSDDHSHGKDGHWGACVGEVGPKPETCNGIDDDCDGVKDEGLPVLSCGVGECAVTQPSCVNGAPQSCVPKAPQAEVCDGLDNDCNGVADDGLGATTCGVGACQVTTPNCVGGQLTTCVPGAPQEEVCDGIDNDCDGLVDEGLGTITCGVGACQVTIPSCVGGVAQTCVPNAPQPETCDGVDNDCNGLVDDGQAACLTLDSSPAGTVELVEGTSRNILTLINLANATSASVTVLNDVTISPSNGGVTLTSDYPGGYSTSTSTSFVLNQVVSAWTAGSYVITNTATVAGTPIQGSSHIVVKVVPPGGDPTIYPPGIQPDGVRVGAPTIVTATARIARYTSPPSTISLRQVNGVDDPIVATLHDDGFNGDLLAGDGVYSGRFTVTAPSEAPLVFRATGVFSGVAGERTSPSAPLAVTCHPTSLVPHDDANEVVDPATGELILCNQIEAVFAPGSTCADKDAAAALVGGTIVGSAPGLGLYQIALPGACTGQNARGAVSVLAGLSQIAEVDAAFVGGTLDEVIPNDPRFAEQINLTKIRADEAWVIARGGALVAVVDSGVDRAHEELAGKVISGDDLIENDGDPLDCFGHGTQLASVIAAGADNGVGMAGVAWNSSILSVRMARCDGSFSFSIAANGIKKAADAGAKIINASWSVGVSPPGLQAAIDYANDLGAIVVTSAGNGGTNALTYPCAYPNSLCVGSTTKTDTRAPFSNFGEQVRLSAPGEAILVAMNGGGYGTVDGTSLSAATVSGSLAVLASNFPAMASDTLRGRLLTTAVPLTGQLVGRRIDLFEAVFNGSFEDDITGWTAVGTAGAPTALGPLLPQDGSRMGMISSGPDSAVVESSLEQQFNIQPGVASIPITFSYNFVTEEYPEFVGSIYNDNLRIVLVDPGGAETSLAYEDINTSTFTSVAGIDFPGGDTTVGETGWKTVTATIPVTVGTGIYRIKVRDEGDGIYDSNVLIDHIRFK